MTGQLSFAQIAAVMAQRSSPPKLLYQDGTLPSGSTPGDILQSLMLARQGGMLPVSPACGRERLFGICLVIVDRLPHEDIWRHWIETANALAASLLQDKSSSSPVYRAELFIHAKSPELVSSLWVRQRLLPFTFRPDWNSIEVVKAALSTLRAAVCSKLPSLSGDNTFVSADRVLLGTESCIPLYSVEDCGKKLWEEDKGWMNCYHQPKSTWERSNCFDAVDTSIIPSKAVTKTLPGWVVFTGCQAAEIVSLVSSLGGWGEDSATHINLKDVTHSTITPISSSTSNTTQAIVHAFGPSGQWKNGCGGVFAPEEVFFPTMLNMLGYISPSKPSDGIRRISAVYAVWEKNGDPNPVSFSELSESLLQKMRQSGAIIGRKFVAGSVSLQLWKKLILHELDNPLPLLETVLPECTSITISHTPSPVIESETANVSLSSTHDTPNVASELKRPRTDGELPPQYRRREDSRSRRDYHRRDSPSRRDYHRRDSRSRSDYHRRDSRHHNNLRR